ncbi:zinc ABC transporter substrate-binding protein [Vibrio galatheae]|uniref:High-affinity zinc uptake system protein ZnuA n=1 Tax=Vibrio galatheae TaxID=579748 RepID=A0A0F4NJN7_9VIBR|nr:zinc ABC transporter substrate-binding protein ZnuA [Vibrio galatheae]KJY83058.1 zinc ABC transporter substrate-binding protein [Vibrio galatheae]
MKRFLTACVMVLASTSIAHASAVLTSIKPIQLITLELTKNISKPEVLLAANTSPHDYALRPSDVKRLHDAKLIIWYGKDLEPFLTKVLMKRDNVLTISEIEGLALREFTGHHHDHDGHDHGSHDPHFWLGYKPTLQVAEAIAEKLIQLDADNRSQYLANLQEFTQTLAQQNNDIALQLKPVSGVGYYVFHDAYGYFEQDFQLNHLGYFTVSPERKPGAKTLINIRKTLAEEQAKCVFSEPQFTPAVVQSVTRGSNAKTGVLDPLAVDIEVTEGSYFQFKQSLADSFSDCLVK